MLDGLKDCGHALPLADAHGCQSELGALVAHAVQQGGCDPRAAGSQRVPDRDGSAAKVDLFFADAQEFEHGEHLDGERLVNLDAIDLIEGKARSLQCFSNCRNRSDAHFFGVHAGHGHGSYPGDRLLAQFSGLLLRHHE